MFKALLFLLPMMLLSCLNVNLTSFGQETAEFSAIIYLLFCGFCLVPGIVNVICFWYS